MLKLKTGTLAPDEIAPLLDALPGDLTFVGADDSVRYFNRPRKRLFSRGPEILGRSVQSCHPEKSVLLVNQVLADLKSGQTDAAEFRVTIDGSPVAISYLAVRDGSGRYLGCLEFARAVAEAAAP
jgi:DUF438 domain-containing protein